MANIFEQYGIKEVADVTIYKVGGTSSSPTYTPFLFLDTLKVSTLEQTAEQVDARGGKGNPKLITWDYGKEINVTLEDALYSPRSMALMWGGENGVWENVTTITKMLKYTGKGNETDASTIVDGLGKAWKVNYQLTDEGTTASVTKFEKDKIYTLEVEATATNGAAKKLVIGSDDFPGTYKIVGDTYARNRNTGEDEYFQFIIPRAKMSAEQTLTLEAEGDPTTFNLNLTVLRPENGSMLELIQYTLPDAPEAGE